MSKRDALSQRILNWGLANAFHQKFSLENRHASRVLGGDDIENVPFGSTVVNTTNNHGSPLARLSQAAVVALGVGAGGLGLANLAGIVGQEIPPPPVNATSSEPRIVEGIIEWEFDGDEFSIGSTGEQR